MALARLDSWILAPLLAFGLAVGLPVSARGYGGEPPPEEIRWRQFLLELQSRPEEGGSYFRAEEGAVSFYKRDSTVGLVLPTDEFDQPVSGPAHLIDFHVPSRINRVGYHFELMPRRDHFHGEIVVEDGFAELSFPAFDLPYRMGPSEALAEHGWLRLELGTEPAFEPAGCDGQTEDSWFEGEAWDLATGRMGLVASTCPYYTEGAGGITAHDHSFRYALQGEITYVPEAEGLLPLAAALLLLAGLSGRATAQAARR